MRIKGQNIENLSKKKKIEIPRKETSLYNAI
jgi:hypothetical protein